MKRILLYLAAFGGLWFGIHTALIIADGLDDHIQPSDIAVVLGTRVDPNGAPSTVLQARLDKTLELYRKGLLSNVMVSGGLGGEGFDEAAVMRDYLCARGIPADSIIVDHQGNDTYLTAEHARQLMLAHNWNSALIVSQYYHVPRVRLAMSRLGIKTVYAAHADSPLDAEFAYAIFREFFAYYYYLVRSYPQI